MTPVRPAHKAQSARLTELATTNTRTIKIGSKNRYDEKYSLSVTEMREWPDEVRAGSVSLAATRVCQRSLSAMIVARERIAPSRYRVCGIGKFT
jgi:hypothetical protein